MGMYSKTLQGFVRSAYILLMQSTGAPAVYSSDLIQTSSKAHAHI